MKLQDLKIKFSEAKYWYLSHPAEKATITLVWKLPTRIIYWAVIRAAARVEPDRYPGDVTATQMLDALGGPDGKSS